MSEKLESQKILKKYKRECPKTKNDQKLRVNTVHCFH